MIHLILLALSLVQAKEFDFDVKVSFVQPNSTDDLETVCTIETNQLDATFDIIWLLNNKQDGILKGQSARDVIISVKRTPDNLGNLTCSVTGNLGDIQLKREKTVELEFETGLLLDVIGDVKLAGLQATISCTAKGFPLKFIKWFYEDRLLDWKDHGIELLENKEKYRIQETLIFESVKREHNGTYTCEAHGLVQEEENIDLIIEDKPDVQIDFALGVGKEDIYVNWTVVEWNEKVQNYVIKVMKEGTEEWRIGHQRPITGNVTNFVIRGLEPNSTYSLQIEAKNKFGSSISTEKNAATTLAEDHVFTPKASAGGGTSTSVSTSWTAPPEEMKYLLGYFVVKLVDAVTNEEKQAIVYNQKQHLFENLKPARNYTFTVKSCNMYTEECGPWSTPTIGTTIDGESSPPKNVRVFCIKGKTNIDPDAIAISWDPPEEPNGKIIHYQLRLSGQAEYYDQHSIHRREDYGPMTGTSEATEFRFHQVPANTNFTVQVSGTTSSKKSGLIASSSCFMGPSPPSMLDLNKVGWSRVRMMNPADYDSLRISFKVNVPRLSERFGEVCCYRLILVKLSEDRTTKELPEAESLQYGFYRDVEHQLVYAYLAEIIDRGYLDQTILVGDGSVIDNSKQQCIKCREAAFKTNMSAYSFSNEISSPFRSSRIKRESSQSVLEDGSLDKAAVYTGLLEVLVRNPVTDEVTSVFSSYFKPISTSAVMAEETSSENMPLIIALAVLCSIAILLLIFVVSLLLLRRYGKKASEGAHENMSLSGTCRFIMRQLRDGRTLLTSHEPLVSIAPIPKEEMMAAFLERRKDSDYGFQEEFEMLPDRFPDRTTKATDAFENLSKNRYPDIKAYDQTRVKLFPVLGSTDYINANFVTGYKERKKFICAQGPMESTVQDFWRMIWEQRVEIIVMLTNLEEYNKTKCFRYWPEPETISAANSNTIYSVPDPETSDTTPSNGTLNSDHVVIDFDQQPVTKGREKIFGDVKVLHVKQTRYADYIIRELQVSRPKSPSPRSPSRDKSCPIYENTLIQEIESEETELEREVRPVFQYHFIVWKDFQAPEYPFSILRFIKRLNEDYSPEKGPILVHCSAGVGRTGSLVAIDSLQRQMEEEGCISIFNTIADLRHQRNFLVQSLKQYIFVYRSMMEYVLFGDTEIEAFKLEEHLKNLTALDSDESLKSPLKEEFE
ncbi:hypothetical protein QYM36_007454, partial [Artemia franciscana]